MRVPGPYRLCRPGRTGRGQSPTLGARPRPQWSVLCDPVSSVPDSACSPSLGPALRSGVGVGGVLSPSHAEAIDSKTHMPGATDPPSDNSFQARGGWARTSGCAHREPAYPGMFHLPDFGIHFSSLLVTSLCPESALIEELSNTRWKKPKGMKVTALYSLLRAFKNNIHSIFFFFMSFLVHTAHNPT